MLQNQVGTMQTEVGTIPYLKDSANYLLNRVNCGILRDVHIFADTLAIDTDSMVEHAFQFTVKCIDRTFRGYVESLDHPDGEIEWRACFRGPYHGIDISLDVLKELIRRQDEATQ